MVLAYRDQAVDGGDPLVGRMFGQAQDDPRQFVGMARLRCPDLAGAAFPDGRWQGNPTSP